MLRILSLLLIVFAVPASAHFSEGGRPRILMVSEASDGLMVHLRVPMPIAYSDVVDHGQRTATLLDHPILRLEKEGGVVRHRVSIRQLGLTLDSFERRILTMLNWTADGEPLRPILQNWTIHSEMPDEPFDTVEEAEAFLEAPIPPVDPVFEDSFIDAKYFFASVPGTATLTVQSALPDFILGSGITVDNHMVDRRSTSTGDWFVDGQLQEPVRFVGSWLVTAQEFGARGLNHIITGWDHIALVLCFALGLGWSSRLFWLITAFTLGHSITLAFGAMGYVPRGDWFIPSVEIGIAASIAIAAWAAWKQTFHSIPVGVAVGLLHGFGFASFLSESLHPDAAFFPTAIASFNIGIEVGQIAVVAIALAAFWAISRLGEEPYRFARLGAIAALGATGLYWTAERVVGVLT